MTPLTPEARAFVEAVDEVCNSMLLMGGRESTIEVRQRAWDDLHAACHALLSADAGREALIDALDKVAQDLTPGVIRMRAFQQCKRCDQMRSSSGNFCNDCHRQIVLEARAALARE